MEGGYEGAEAFGRRTFGILGEREHFESRDCIFCLGYFSGLEFGWTVAGVQQRMASYLFNLSAEKNRCHLLFTKPIFSIAVVTHYSTWKRHLMQSVRFLYEYNKNNSEVFSTLFLLLFLSLHD
jgi:hypothetical protein